MQTCKCSSVEIKSLKPDFANINGLNFQKATIVVDFDTITFKNSFGICTNCHQTVFIYDGTRQKLREMNEIEVFINRMIIKSESEDQLFEFEDEILKPVFECVKKNTNNSDDDEDIQEQQDSSKELELTSTSLPISVPTFGRRPSTDPDSSKFQPPHVLAKTWRDTELPFGTRPTDRKPSVL